MIDAQALLADSKVLVKRLIEDLRMLDETDAETASVFDAEYRAAHSAGRTALSRTEWAEGFCAQIAVAWTLGCVFVRFSEDNELTLDPLLCGPGAKRAIALDHRTAYFEANPAHDDRHWLREIFTRYAALPATGEIFGAHNPIWMVAPSADGARSLVQEMQVVDPTTGEIRHNFTDPDWDTRFLGDLYQDLSEHAKKNFALLQTPEFVEEFILDRTLDPAIATFGLRDTTLIDPTCGSGHFLLGAFHRLFDRWHDAKPGTGPRELARRAVNAIGGVDLNPFAVAIARFRLLVAALRASGEKRLADAPAYPIHIAVGDSLLHGDLPGRLAGSLASDEITGAAAHGYATEDIEEARAILCQKWHAVVGNPPYIIVRDAALNILYRERFDTCHRQYSLGVPFTERFFQLALTDADPDRCGFVGMITANSFMKREFGKRLVENWVPKHDLTCVIDTKGAFIPGHGTPTVIVFGRNRPPVDTRVRAVMGIRSEPSRPSDPAFGRVWSSIIELVDHPGSESEYVSVVDVDRLRLAKHPWNLGGGGAAELKELLDEQAELRLTDLIDAITALSYTRLDDAYYAPSGSWSRLGVPSQQITPVATGEDIRDWALSLKLESLFPYNSNLDAYGTPGLLRALWPNKTLLRARRELGGMQEAIGLTWFEWNRFLRHRYRTPWAIAFANVATHNHFVLSRGVAVFNAHSPVIKLTSEDESRHLQLLGLLNSSTAAFWMQQVFHNKGRPGADAAAADEPYEFRFEFDATKLHALPIPPNLTDASAAALDRLAAQLGAASPAAVAAVATPTADRLAEAEAHYAQLRSEMIAAQERLDWEVYSLYDLIDGELTTGHEPEPPLNLGERAFEIVLARKVAAGAEESSWFARHGSTPISELPTRWSDRYRRLVERRIELIESDQNIGLIERPEHKRRWAAKPWAELLKIALRSWLLDRLEDPSYWPDPASLKTTARLVAEARTDAEFVEVARLYAGRDDVDLAALVAELVRTEAVPYLAQLRYTETGMRRHRQWLHTWDMQRREDAGEDIGLTSAPPKYTKADFQGIGWERRGKLDVPKERFISYPGASRETDVSLVIGWAGWDHLARARALATWYLQAKADGRDKEHLIPLLAGLNELKPWLLQWYDDPNADPALNRPGSQIASLVDSELRSLHLTRDDLVSWRPVKTSRTKAAR